jgi:cell shape-determining protein MreD
MRALTHIAVTFLLLVLLGALWRVTPFEVAAPDVALVAALYLGVTARSYLWEATAAVLMIGYLADLLAGAPRGLSSLVLALVCILSRLVSARLLVRGNLFVGVFTLLWAAAGGLFQLGVRVYFGAGTGPFWRELVTMASSALLTAALAPLLFRIFRSVDARFARTEREREATREGYLS